MKLTLHLKSATHVIVYALAVASILVAAAMMPAGKTNKNKKSALAKTNAAIVPATTAKSSAMAEKKVNNAQPNLPASAIVLDEQKKETADKLTALPLIFRKNMGQWEKSILYRGTVQGKNITIMKDKVSFYASREVEENEEQHEEATDEIGKNQSPDVEKHESLTWNVHFKGMNPQARVEAEGQAESHTNYIYGNDSSKWVYNVPDYRIVKYKNIYKNIDLHYYGLKNRELEYDYVVKPGGKIENIQMELEGTQGIFVNENGEIEIKTAWGIIKEKAPYSYQTTNGKRGEVSVRYRQINSNTFGFEAAQPYNKNAALIIDPQTMVWSTFMGATADNSLNYSFDIAVDGARNTYITGYADNTYPTTVGQAFGGGVWPADAFVTKINPSGTAIVYSTYLGGSGNDFGHSIAVTSGGLAYITGGTLSTDFPTTGGVIQPSDPGGTGGGTGFTWATGSANAFVTKLNATGTVNYSTYLGGSTNDGGGGIAINSAGEAFITGYTYSTNFPLMGAFQTVKSSTTSDAFITKLNATATALVYSSYLGYDFYDRGNNIAINSAGEAFIAGSTVSSNFATTAGVFGACPTSMTEHGFVAKINSAGTAILYASCLGAEGTDIAVNAAGEAFIAEKSGTQTAVRINSTATAVIYSTALSGQGNFPHITITTGDYAYISGACAGPCFYSGTIGMYQPSFQGGNSDMTITMLDPSGAVVCGTFVGGTDTDYQYPSIAVFSSSGNPDTVYVTGTVHSTDFPTTAGVYKVIKPNPLGSDEPVIFKMVSCASGALPINLLTLAGSCSSSSSEKAGVRLNWSTASETNNDYFTIERSSEPGVRSWEKIGTVKGAGNSSSTLSYEFIDNLSAPNSQLPTLYYRLKQTDFDGKTETFNNKQIAVDVTECAVKVFPNPAGNTLNIPYTAEQDGEVILEVYDVIGKLVKESRVLGIKGNNKFTLDLSTVAQGMYVLRIKNGAKENNQKFVKQ